VPETALNVAPVVAAAPAPGSPDGAAGAPRSPPVIRRRRRRRKPFVVAAAVLAALLLAGLLTAWQADVFTPSRRLPSLQGMTLIQARHALAPGRFTLFAGRPEYSISVGPGLVMRQTPPPRTSLKPGATVRVVVSKGPPSVAVPSLTGVDCGVAARLLQEAHLKADCPALSAYNATIPVGQVINWSYNNQLNPTTATYGGTVLVAVSKGPPPVPIPSGLAGGTFAAAQSALQALGFTVTQAQEQSTQYPAGQVTRTTPAAGTPAPVGSAVTVYVSQGPPIVTVPDVTGKSVAQATAALQAVGLTVGNIYGAHTGPTATVLATDPAAGTQLQAGQPVTLLTK
jgi:serine/threonine-protein kinase